jgi:hypothetical protein
MLSSMEFGCWPRQKLRLFGIAKQVDRHRIELPSHHRELSKRRNKGHSDKIAAKKRWVLIEGPAPGDAHFLGRWLLAAAEADKLLQEQYEQDPSFKLTISRLELVYAFAFSPPTGLLGSRMNLPYRAVSKHLGTMGE